MGSTFFKHSRKLRLWGVMSSLYLLLWAGIASAHEVVPAITDLAVRDGVVRMEMRANIEAQLSGIDLDVVEDTDNAENSSDYDALRALSNVDIAARTSALVETWNALPLLSADGAPVVLSLESVEVPDVSDGILTLSESFSAEHKTKQLPVGNPDNGNKLDIFITISDPHGGSVTVNKTIVVRIFNFQILLSVTPSFGSSLNFCNLDFRN